MRRPLALVAAGLAVTSCGPTDEEAARAVLLVAPLAYGMGVGLLAILAWLWRKLEPGLRIERRPMLISLAIVGLLAALSLVGVSEEEQTQSMRAVTNGIPGVLEWVNIAAVYFGSSYLAGLLICWRIWLRARPRTAFTWSHVPVLALLLAPCPVMASGVTEHWLNVTEYLWTGLGCQGIVPATLFLAAIIEVVVRIRRTRGRSALGEALVESANDVDRPEHGSSH